MLNGSHCDKIEKDKEVMCKTFGEVGEVQGVGSGEGVGGRGAKDEENNNNTK